MERRALLLSLALVPLVVLAGCVGGTGPTTETTSPTATTTETRFDGEARATVTVYNGANETWDLEYTIERNGTTVLDQQRSLAPDSQWNVTTIEQPGNYTFTVDFADGTTLSNTVELPRAVGDRRTYVSVKSDDGAPELMVYWEQ